MTVQAMCGSAGVSRAGYYRHCGRPEGPEEDTELRDAIQKVALEWPAYGRRRVTAELKRRGWQVNHKRVHRMMREDVTIAAPLACMGRYSSAGGPGGAENADGILSINVSVRASASGPLRHSVVKMRHDRASMCDWDTAVPKSERSRAIGPEFRSEWFDPRRVLRSQSGGAEHIQPLHAAVRGAPLRR